MSIELKRKQVELLRVSASEGEIEMSIMDKEAEILRLKEVLKIQVAKRKELETEVKTLEGNK